MLVSVCPAQPLVPLVPPLAPTEPSLVGWRRSWRPDSTVVAAPPTDTPQPCSSQLQAAARRSSYQFHTQSIYTQNMLGCKTDTSICELIGTASKHDALAVCGQETWRSGTEVFQQSGWTFIGHGPDHQSGRGSMGVSILLSGRGSAAWERAGREKHAAGPRLLAVRLVLRCGKRGTHYHRKIGVFLVSAYAPTTGHPAAAHDAYYDDLSRLIARRQPGDVLVVCTDANASIGRDSLGGDSDGSGRAGAVGPFGLPHINAAGRRLRGFLQAQQLASLTTFFRKQFYGTWIHPRSKLAYQLDHILVARDDLCRFKDAGSCPFQLINSDHRAVGCKLLARVSFRRKADPRSSLLRLDTSSLYDLTGQQAFARNFVHRVKETSLIAPKVQTALEVGNDGRVTLHLTTCVTVVPSVPYVNVAQALKATAMELLPVKPKPQPAWFEAKRELLTKLIASRDAALNAHHLRPSPETATSRSLARATLQTGLRAAKSDWVVNTCKQVSDGVVAQHGTSKAWKLVAELRDGLGGVRRHPAPAKMRMPDGSLAATPEENAAVFATHFKQLYGRVPICDTSIPELLRQRPVAADLDHPPTHAETHCALSRLRDTGPGDSGLPARFWKALGSTEESFVMVHQLMLDFWDTELMPAEWETGLLKILAKKGDKSDPGNYRGIMLLEVAYKVMANILHLRLQPVLESPTHVDHESQCGFRTKRGTCDASSSIKTLVKKRREHGLDTWILFIDLVKAFDRVPRCATKKPPVETEAAAEAASDVEIGMLWRVLLKFGVPPKLVRMLISMHETVTVKFDVDGVVTTLLSIIGVKQGDLLGPELFDFYIAAVMETWRTTHSYEVCAFRTRDDFKMTGRNINATGDDFSVPDSLYADDTGLPFCSRADLEQQTPLLMTHFADWGMEIHAGVLDPMVHSGLLDFTALPPIKKSKSEVLFCSKPHHLYSDPTSFDGTDLSPILLPNNGFMEVVDRFPYLGDIVSRDGDDAAAVDARVESGGKAFGALRACVFASTSISNKAKKAVYEAIVLSTVLYGCETWSLTEELYRRLRCMHAHHLRAMCRVSRSQAWEHHISTQELGQRLGLDSIEFYIARRQLRWLGHVSRMPYETRLPRRLLSAWVPHRRPIGSPSMTYGRSIFKALEMFRIDKTRWPELAANRSAWRETLRTGVAPQAFLFLF